MDTDPHDFSLTMQELFVVTDALTAHRRTIEVQLSKAFSDGNTTAIDMLLSERQTVTDIHDMLSMPIQQAADEWKLAEHGIYDDFERDDDDREITLSDPNDWLEF